MKREEILLGNGAIALGLLEAGCQVVTSYPGAPSSEILPEVIRLVKSEKLNTYVEWTTNEKVALDNAFAASITGKRAACCIQAPWTMRGKAPTSTPDGQSAALMR